MSGLSPSFRFPLSIPEGAAHPSVKDAIESHDNSITDINQAIVSLKGQINNLGTGTTSTTSATTTTNTTTSTENVTQVTVSGGTINNQSGVTAYTTTQSDNGALIILSDTSAVAVTLNKSVTIPWYCFVINEGTSNVTLTPQFGLINGSASEIITPGLFSVVFFDGSNFYAAAIPIVPSTFAAVAHQFLTSYNAATGVLTAAQPAFTDISGMATPAQLPAATGSAEGIVQLSGDVGGSASSPQVVETHLATPLPLAQGGTGTATPSLVPGANIAITGTFPNQTVATTGFSGTITTAKLTTVGTNGSMTFVAGVLTSQVAAT